MFLFIKNGNSIHSAVVPLYPWNVGSRTLSDTKSTHAQVPCMKWLVQLALHMHGFYTRSGLAGSMGEELTDEKTEAVKEKLLQRDLIFTAGQDLYHILCPPSNHK